jgi:hypothetical protein
VHEINLKPNVEMMGVTNVAGFPSAQAGLAAVVRVKRLSAQAGMAAVVRVKRLSAQAGMAAVVRVKQWTR